jgi:hypothetical protein
MVALIIAHGCDHLARAPPLLLSTTLSPIGLHIVDDFSKKVRGITLTLRACARVRVCACEQKGTSYPGDVVAKYPTKSPCANGACVPFKVC